MRSKVSKHAGIRIRERTGLPKKAVAKIAEKAYEKGVTHKEATGRLRDYFACLFMRNRSVNNIRF